jgi:hypothetical protein
MSPDLDSGMLLVAIGIGSLRVCSRQKLEIAFSSVNRARPRQEKPTTVATSADPAQAQNSTVLLARYRSSPCARR